MLENFHTHESLDSVSSPSPEKDLKTKQKQKTNKQKNPTNFCETADHQCNGGSVCHYFWYKF